MTEPGLRDQAEGRLPEARRRATRWPGWVWLIPAGAVILVGWFIYQGWVVGSHEVVVRFTEAEGLSPGAPVVHKGVQVGHVDGIRLGDDMEAAEVRLVLREPVGSRLGEKTQFWIERPRLLAGDLRGLMAGARVAVRPGGGARTEVFQGREAPPPSRIEEPGRSILLAAPDAGGLLRGAPVTYRGVEVGRVVDMRLSDAGREVRIEAFIRDEHAGLVREGSVFWQAGGASISTRGGVDVTLPSIPALVTGAVAFETPAVLAGGPAENGARFALHDSRASAEAAAKGTRLAYFIRFPKAVSGLSRGDPVELDGARVGRITHVGLEIDAETASLATPMQIEIDARALGVDLEAVRTRKDLRDRLNEKLGALVRQGLRAKVSSGGFLPGGKSVTLVLVEGAEAGALDRTHEPPAIPAVSAGEE